MTNKVFTIITFAPVQGFIENSRKLRDLYGSSFIISYLSGTLCKAAHKYNYHVVSPASSAIFKGHKAISNQELEEHKTQGLPNQIIIEGDTSFSEEIALTIFNTAWQEMVKACQFHIEDKLPNYEYHWARSWNAWSNYAWEFFCAEGEPGDSITNVRQKLNEIKRQRSWIGINWVGESSTLSGSDAVAWYGMTDEMNPKTAKMGEIDKKIKDFYKELSEKLIDTIIDKDEQLSIPELVKRLVTLYPIKQQLEDEFIKLPKSFTELNRITKEENRWTGWFQGDGDRIGEYFKDLVKQGKNERDELEKFSKAMIVWGQDFENNLPKSPKFRSIYAQQIPPEGRIIYAGGDDFLGVLYRKNESKSDELKSDKDKSEQPKLTASECLPWFYEFPKIWEKHQQPITVSIGFVWAAGGVPQREVLQHCRLAEKSAKSKGRDRLAIRILYNSGNYLEWVCPWWWLQALLESYRDRDGDTIKFLRDYPKANKKQPNWTHFYNDICTLESRHAFGIFHDAPIDIALEIFEIYFGKENRENLQNKEYWWNKSIQKAMGRKGETGILGQKKTYQDDQEKIEQKKVNQAINDWVINLAKVGFRLFQVNNYESGKKSKELSIMR